MALTRSPSGFERTWLISRLLAARGRPNCGAGEMINLLPFVRAALLSNRSAILFFVLGCVASEEMGPRFAVAEIHDTKLVARLLARLIKIERALGRVVGWFGDNFLSDGSHVGKRRIVERIDAILEPVELPRLCQDRSQGSAETAVLEAVHCYIHHPLLAVAICNVSGLADPHGGQKVLIRTVAQCVVAAPRRSSWLTLPGENRAIRRSGRSFADGALLNDVRQLMRDQPHTFFARRPILPATERDVSPDGISRRLD